MLVLCKPYINMEAATVLHGMMQHCLNNVIQELLSEQCNRKNIENYCLNLIMEYRALQNT